MAIRLCAARGTSTPPSNNVNGPAKDKPRTRNSGGGGKQRMDHPETKGPERLCTAAVSHGRAPHNSTTQSPARHTTSTWRGGAAVLTVKPSAPCTHLTEDRDKGPQAPMPAAVQIVPEAQPREKAPKKPKSGKERALTKRDKK